MVDKHITKCTTHIHNIERCVQYINNSVRTYKQRVDKKLKKQLMEKVHKKKKKNQADKTRLDFIACMIYYDKYDLFGFSSGFVARSSGKYTRLYNKRAPNIVCAVDKHGVCVCVCTIIILYITI